MGLFWDLVQQSQLSDQRAHASSLEQRVQILEGELRRTQELLHSALERLEKHVGEDLNRDGRIGR